MIMIAGTVSFLNLKDFNEKNNNQFKNNKQFKKRTSFSSKLEKLVY